MSGEVADNLAREACGLQDINDSILVYAVSTDMVLRVVFFAARYINSSKAPDADFDTLYVIALEHAPKKVPASLHKRSPRLRES